MVYSDSSVNIFYIMKNFVRFFTFMLYFKFPERKLKGFRNRSGNDADSSFIYHANFSWFLPVRLLSVVLCCGRTCNEKLQCSRALQRGWVNCGLCVLWLINFFAGQHGFTRLLCEKYLRNTTFTLAVQQGETGIFVEALHSRFVSIFQRFSVYPTRFNEHSRRLSSTKRES